MYSVNNGFDREWILLTSTKVGIFLVLIMPLIVSGDTFFPFIVGKALYSRSVIEITAVIWLVLALNNPKYRPTKSTILIALLAYLAVSLAASFAGVSVQRSLWSTYERMQGVVDLAHWVVFSIVVTSTLRTPKDWKNLLNFNLFISLIVALMGVSVELGGQVPFYGFLNDPARMSLTLGNPTYLGAYMLVNLLIGLGLLADSLLNPKHESSSSSRTKSHTRLRKKSQKQSTGIFNQSMFWWKIYWIITIVLDFWIFTKTGTRGAFLGFGVSMVTLTFAYLVWGKLKLIKVASTVLISSMVLVGLLIILGANTSVVNKLSEESFIVKRLIFADVSRGSFTERWWSLKFGAKGFVDKPILGWGPDNYVVPWGRHYQKEANVPTIFDQAHNKPMEELVTKGSLGLISYISLWTLMIIIILSRIRQFGADKEILTLLIGAAMVGYFTQNLFLFDTPATTLQFFILLSFAITLKNMDWDQELTATSESTQRKSVRTNRLQELGYVLSKYKFTNNILMLLLIVVAGTVVYFANIRAFQAGSAIVQTSRSGITWSERFDHFEDSIHTFEPLANYVRTALFTSLAKYWHTMTESDTKRALKIMEIEIQALNQSEPEWWRAYVDVAQVYQSAAITDPKHLETAQFYLEKAILLAPDTKKVEQAIGRQSSIEQEYGITSK